MGVRVKLKIRVIKTGADIEAHSLLNAGFETDEPQILVPQRVAELLKVWPQLPDGTEVRPYSTVAGLTRLYRAPNAVEVQIQTGDRLSNVIRCDLVICEKENEVLLSDAALSELKIVIEDAKKGLWHFRDETIIRESAEVQYW